jgi:hypothetical protein
MSCQRLRIDNQFGGKESNTAVFIQRRHTHRIRYIRLKAGQRYITGLTNTDKAQWGQLLLLTGRKEMA